MIKRLTALAVALALSGTVFASARPTPITLSIKPHSTALFWFHNVSKNNVLLDHEPLHPSASAGWGSLVAPGNWNVIVLQNYHKTGTETFTLTCQSWTNNSITPLACKHRIQYGVVSFKQLPKQFTNGEAWLAENQTQTGLQKILAKYNFKLMK